MRFGIFSSALAIAALCGAAVLASSVQADDRAYLINTIEIKFGMRDRFRELVRPCANAAAKSGITLEIYAIEIGNGKKIFDIWGGPSIEAIKKSWEHPDCASIPLGEILESEIIEAARMMNLSDGEK